MNKGISPNVNNAEEMNAYFEQLFSAAEKSLLEELPQRELSDEGICVLCQQILALSDTGKELFYGRYCYQMSNDAMQTVFGTSFPAGRLQYYKSLLSSAHNLKEGERISERSYQKASEMALDQDMERTEKEANRQKMLVFPAGTKKIIRVLAKGIVAAMVILTVGFTTAITVNAEFRERVINWFIETFTEYSKVQTSSDQDITIEDLRSYYPAHIPERYTHTETVILDIEIAYYYEDPEGNTLYIRFSIPGTEVGINTENMEIKALEFRGEEAFMAFDDENRGTFAFVVDGIPIFIGGQMSEEEAMAIANGIEKR
ncbi:MAG: hypothetical protein IJR00_05590 [Lachnospiraceae bacterium]|nr:hypothetical protein [Lachnospiraceae bacterium]